MLAAGWVNSTESVFVDALIAAGYTASLEPRANTILHITFDQILADKILSIPQSPGYLQLRDHYISHLTSNMSQHYLVKY